MYKHQERVTFYEQIEIQDELGGFAQALEESYSCFADVRFTRVNPAEYAQIKNTHFLELITRRNPDANISEGMIVKFRGTEYIVQSVLPNIRELRIIAAQKRAA